MHQTCVIVESMFLKNNDYIFQMIRLCLFWVREVVQFLTYTRLSVFENMEARRDSGGAKVCRSIPKGRRDRPIKVKLRRIVSSRIPLDTIQHKESGNNSNLNSPEIHMVLPVQQDCGQGSDRANIQIQIQLEKLAEGINNGCLNL